MSETPHQKAKEYFASDYNCAQSVLRAILEYKGIMFEDAKYIPAGFGAGMGTQGQICGAVTGGIMSIGMLCKREEQTTENHIDDSYKFTYQLIERFSNEFGTTICDKLTGVKLKNPDERKRANEEGIFDNICPGFVEKVVEFVLELFPK